jgi:hypothetical protein
MATAVKSKAILKRAPVLIGAPAEKIEKLAISAKLVLGYHRLADLITTPKRLITVLRELEIEPYTQSTVEAYKVSKVQEVRAEIARRKEKNPQSSFRVSLQATWKRTDIDRYKRIIPEFALRKAVMIKEACPDAVIEVDALVIERVRTYDSHASSTSDPDPFLVASLGAERYYIEVWDEKKFEDKLY